MSIQLGRLYPQYSEIYDNQLYIGIRISRNFLEVVLTYEPALNHQKISYIQRLDKALNDLGFCRTVGGWRLSGDFVLFSGPMMTEIKFSEKDGLSERLSIPVAKL